MSEPLRPAAPQAPTTGGPQSLYPSLRSMGRRFVILAAALAAVAVIRGTTLFTIVGIVLVILIACVAKRRIDLDEDAASVVPLFPFLRARRVPWSSIGPFTSTRERAFTLLRAPLLHPAPHGFVRRDGLSFQAVYGPGWLDAPLPADQFAELLESYRGRASIAGPTADAG